MDKPTIPRGDKIMIRPAVVLGRTKMSTDDLSAMEREGALSLNDDELTCDLEAEGLPVARGRLIKRKGGYYFKVLECAGGEE